MTGAFVYFACSALTLGIIAGVFRVEDAQQGRRIVLRRARAWFDGVVVSAGSKLTKFDTYLGRGITRLLLHYAAHSILHRLLALITRMEKRVEHLLRRNKQVAKDIQGTKSKTHLDEIAEHKEEVALTDAQKRKMRSHDN